MYVLNAFYISEKKEVVSDLIPADQDSYAYYSNLISKFKINYNDVIYPEGEISLDF